MCIFTHDLESTANTDFGVTRKFKVVDEFANMESINDEDRLLHFLLYGYLFCVSVTC